MLAKRGKEQEKCSDGPLCKNHHPPYRHLQNKSLGKVDAICPLDISSRPIPQKPRNCAASGSYREAAVFLLSDREANSGPDPIEVSSVAAERGVRVYTVGIGTKEGQKMMLNGWSMRVKLDEDSMKQIADNTGAEYYNAASGEELSKVYESLNTQVTFEKESMEVTALFEALAALCAFVASGLPMLWFTRIF